MATVEAMRQGQTTALVDALLHEAPTGYYWQFKLKDTPTGQQILSLDETELRPLIFELIRRRKRARDMGSAVVCRNILVELLRRKINFTHDELVELVQWFTKNATANWMSPGLLISHLERHVAEEPVSPQLRASILQLVWAMRAGYLASIHGH